ncbi:MAG TPA: hypothetical protein PLV45_00530 [bacterium]|nr:hypothetical protein [bacterium]
MHSGLDRTINGVLLGCILVFLFNIPVSAQVSVGNQIPLPVIFELDPTYAQFVSSNLCVRGDKHGISLVNLDTGEQLQQLLPDQSISVLKRNPHRFGEVLAGTWDGRLFRLVLKDNELELSEFDEIAHSEIMIPHQIMFHPEKTDRLILADYRHLFLCTVKEGKIHIDNTLTPGDPDVMIALVFPDNRSADWFIVSAPQEKRYRGNWDTGKLVDITGKMLEYGYTVGKSGTSFLPRGDFDQYLYINYMSARPTSIIRHPSRPMTYYASTIGTAPLKISVDSRNFYTLEFLASNRMLTFSVDVVPTDTDRLLITTNKTVQFSTDAGATWNTID